MSGAAVAGSIAVIGIGNVLLGDDGFGPSVIELLRAGWQLPEAVELIDAGTPSLDLADYLHGRAVAILIDAVAATGAPGELCLYRGDELLKLPPKPRMSPHEPAVQEALWIVELSGNGPRRVLLVGVIPQSIGTCPGLSPAVRASATAAADLVVRELARCGAAPTPRCTPRITDAWWMREQRFG